MSGTTFRPKDFAQRLRDVRERLGLTQSAMADLVGASFTSYREYERAIRPMRGDQLAVLAAKGFSVDWLLTGEGAIRRGDDQEPPADRAVTLLKTGGGFKVGYRDDDGQFKSLTEQIAGKELARLREEEAASMVEFIDQLTRSPEVAEILGKRVDMTLAEQLWSIHSVNRKDPALDNDTPALLTSLITLLFFIYRDAKLKISSADVALLAAEEYREIYDISPDPEIRQVRWTAAKTRHSRAAAWMTIRAERLAAADDAQAVEK